MTEREDERWVFASRQVRARGERGIGRQVSTLWKESAEGQLLGVLSSERDCHGTQCCTATASFRGLQSLFPRS